MNERIKELNLQAMSIVMNGNDPDGDIEQMYIPSEFTKKFAELIVKECMEACSRANEIRHFVPPTQEQVVLSCMCEIETTFWS